MATGTFATAINCIDGRAQRPVADWIRVNHNVTYVDTLTIPGADEVISARRYHRDQITEVVAISVDKHGSQLIAIAGHYDCAANSVTADEHIRMIRLAAQEIQSWGMAVRVVGLWVNEQWLVDLVADLPAR